MRYYKCKKCGHNWLGRNQREPLECPACKRYDWNIPEKNNQKMKELKQNERKT